MQVFKGVMAFDVWLHRCSKIPKGQGLQLDCQAPVWVVWQKRILYASWAGNTIKVFKPINMQNKKTLVLGATTNPARYSFLAIHKLRENGHDVVAIGNHTGKVRDVTIVTEKKPVKDLDTVTLYLNAGNQKEYYNYILEQKPRRIIFNPGAENSELERLARENNIPTQQACTLVLLSTHQY